MNILISGATGLIGSALKTALTQRGDQIFALTRHPSQNQTDVTWSPDADNLDLAGLPDLDV